MLSCTHIIRLYWQAVNWGQCAYFAYSFVRMYAILFINIWLKCWKMLRIYCFIALNSVPKTVIRFSLFAKKKKMKCVFFASFEYIYCIASHFDWLMVGCSLLTTSTKRFEWRITTTATKPSRSEWPLNVKFIFYFLFLNNLFVSVWVLQCAAIKTNSSVRYFERNK